MARPPKYKNDAERHAAGLTQKKHYAQSERYKNARSAQNHAAYKRKRSRRGTPVIPHVNPRVSGLAKQPVHVSPLLRLIFHDPKLVLSTTLNHDAILSLSTNSEHLNTIPGFEQNAQDCRPNRDIFDLDPVEEMRFDIIHGLYLRHECDSQDIRIDRFQHGDLFYLERDIDKELRLALKRWKALWNNGCGDESMMDSIHLQWVSRAVEHLREELYLLGTAERREIYMSSVMARRIEVPEE